MTSGSARTLRSLLRSRTGCVWAEIHPRQAGPPGWPVPGVFPCSGRDARRHVGCPRACLVSSPFFTSCRAHAAASWCDRARGGCWPRCGLRSRLIRAAGPGGLFVGPNRPSAAADQFRRLEQVRMCRGEVRACAQLQQWPCLHAFARFQSPCSVSRVTSTCLACRTCPIPALPLPGPSAAASTRVDRPLHRRGGSRRVWQRMGL